MPSSGKMPVMSTVGDPGKVCHSHNRSIVLIWKSASTVPFSADTTSPQSYVIKKTSYS